MRRFLNGLYRVSGWAAALFMVLIAVAALAQVVATIVDMLAELFTGTPIGIVIPSYAEFTGYFTAATTFLALAYTFRDGEHIRVELLLQRLTGKRRRRIELWCLFIGGFMSSFFAVYTVGMTLDSFVWGDKSTGLVPLPLWLPQLPMAFGLVVLSVAFVDDYIRVLTGRAPSFAKDKTAESATGQAAGRETSVYG